MKIVNASINLETKSEFDIIDLTERIKNFVQESRIKNGFLNVQTLHTTATVLVNEKEPLLLEDFKNHLEKLSPKDINYHHDNFEKRTVNVCQDECANGCSHCRAIHLPVNVCLNIVDGQLQLGPWQSVLFIELDRARKRQIQLQIIGE